MATKGRITSLKKKTMGKTKKPGLKASQKQIDNYLKKRKEVDEHNRKVEQELDRRRKLLSK